jgi:hypothetical protein
MRVIALFICVASVVSAGCTPGSVSASPTSPSSALSSGAVAAATGWSALGARNEKACWGEATQALARLGEMGYHASHQDNPRLGLRNVARLLHDLGVLPDDSLQSLGAFLSSALGLSIDSCLS